MGKVTLGDRLLIGGLGLVPKNALSRMVGRIARTPIPKPLRQSVIASLSSLFGIKTAEAELPLSEYRSFADWFTRRLSSNARTIQAGPGNLVSPCDGTVGEYGPIENGRLVQVKGRPYTIEKLLIDQDLKSIFQNGWFITIYLSPSNYHRVHSPIDGKVTSSMHIPGHLWPVNRAGVHLVDELFAVNERIVTVIDGDKSQGMGRVGIIMVGATSVGQMTVTYDDKIVSNTKTDYSHTLKEYSNPSHLKMGDELGVFNLGSTVIILLEHSRFLLTTGGQGAAIQMGDLIGTVGNQPEPDEGHSISTQG